MSTEPVDYAIEVEDLCFSYDKQVAVSIDTCKLPNPQSLVVIGPSGCGKTTFLHLLAGLLQPDSGVIRILGQDLSQLPGARMDRFRGQHIGMVFQRLYLLPSLTVHQNILLAQRLARKPAEPAHLSDLYEMLGLSGLEHRRPDKLSQGQAQRVAIARALVHKPKLIIADEPTSALDDHNAEQALNLLKGSAAACGAALLVVTHDKRLRGQLDHEFEMAAQS